MNDGHNHKCMRAHMEDGRYIIEKKEREMYTRECVISRRTVIVNNNWSVIDSLERMQEYSSMTMMAFAEHEQ